MFDIDDVARWVSGRAVWWSFATLALLVLTHALVGTNATLGVLGVPGALLVDAATTAFEALGLASDGATWTLGLVLACYVPALVVGAVVRAVGAAWRWRKALLYPEEYAHY
ncbi:hypothetical protein [Halarchaeum nitratireducens]|uniref:Uncharacterized protein n=1 Tax=Halarchaeum nitratireducens TaxID=489913 RepID=A0A830G9W5_9EURY|nr:MULTISPECIES: hypothetical protein [Halarchaeum]MBP2250159.1 hypothetical protein [Halarchaeum solikamskense]GGN11589.1 hypothetical protein GCM10009021_09430 [Halarchaeum nitratireducens]